MSESNDPLYTQAVYLAGLIHKYREKQPLDDEEQRQLEQWVNSDPANSLLFESLLDRERLTEELKALLRYNEKAGLSAVLEALGKPRAAVRPMWRIVVRRGIAAALLLLLAGVGWRYFVRRTAADRENAPALAAGSTRAGDYKAILTLADGSQVALDSGLARLPERQGAARIEQQKGSLIYSGIGDGPAAGNGPDVYNTITVPRGGQYHVVLADGSGIWLNAASSVTYPVSFNGDRREVKITGEAYFSVAKDAEKPFIVVARTMKVQVVGTEFDVMAYPDENAVRTTLINGAVKAGSVGGSEELLLRPGDQAALVNGSAVLHVERPNPDDVTGWRRGELHCHQTDISAIMRQVARWYDVSIEYRGSVANIDFSGQLSRKQRVEDVLDILSDTRKVHFVLTKNKTIVVIPGPK